MADIDNSIDKIEIDGKNYNVSIAPSGILDTTSNDGFVSNDENDNDITDLQYTSVKKIVATETHNSIFSKLTSMIKNIRILNKLVNRVATTGKTGLVKIGTGISVDGSGTISVNTDALKTTLLSIIYPVGSIYLTVGTTDPNRTIGGTWKKLAAGYVLATDNKDLGTRRYGTVGTTTAGKDKITLSPNQLPAHTHPSGTLKVTGKHSHTGTTDTKTIKNSGHTHTYNKNSYLEIVGVNSGDPNTYRIGVRDGDFKLVTHSGSTGVSTGKAGDFDVSHTHDFTTDEANLSLSVIGNTGNTGSGSEIDVKPYTYPVYAWRRTG